MEATKEVLEAMFDEMLASVHLFKKKTYADTFKKFWDKYKGIIDDISKHYEEAEDKEALLDELACVIPDYAYQKMQKMPKRQRQVHAIDYNMTVVVYVVPVITYTKDAVCDKLAELLTQKWNQKDICNLTIGRTSYEELCSGFKWKLCYITTAVCESQHKPDDCYELTTLRNYRDQYLMQTEEGQKLVEAYYDIAPGIVLSVGMQKNADEIYKGIYRDYLLPCIQMTETGRNEECKKLYIEMVRHLQKKYLYS